MEKAITEKPEETAALKKWLVENESDIDDLGYDAYAKGRSDFTITSNLPPKELWPYLSRLLECNNDYDSVEPTADGITIHMKSWENNCKIA